MASSGRQCVFRSLLKTDIPSPHSSCTRAARRSAAGLRCISLSRDGFALFEGVGDAVHTHKRNVEQRKMNRAAVLPGGRFTTARRPNTLLSPETASSSPSSSTSSNRQCPACDCETVRNRDCPIATTPKRMHPANVLAFHTHTQIPTTDNMTQYYACRHCNERYQSEVDFIKHVRTHMTTASLFPCRLCTRNFTQNSHLTRHFRLVHLGERNYACTMCRSTFGEQSTLKNHMRTHTKERLHCNLCSRTFSHPSNLRAHVAMEHMMRRRRIIQREEESNEWQNQNSTMI